MREGLVSIGESAMCIYNCSIESPRERRRLDRERRHSHHENVDLRRTEHYDISQRLHEESSDVITTINPLCLLHFMYFTNCLYKYKLIFTLSANYTYLMCARLICIIIPSNSE